VEAAKKAGGVARVQLNLEGSVQLILGEQAPAADRNPCDEAPRAAD
jgi:hypothetical protein